MRKLILVVSLGFVLVGCTFHKKKEVKDPITGNLLEQYETIEDKNGSVVKDGEYKRWYDNEKIYCTGEYSNDKKTGEWKVWDKKGQQLNIAEYKNDHLNGRCQSWDYDLGTYTDVVYENDTLNGVAKKSYLKNDQIQVEETYKMGVLDGSFTEYAADGKKQSEYSYKEGVQTGTWHAWNAKGELTHTMVFENGDCKNLLGKWKGSDRNHTIEFKSNNVMVESYPMFRFSFGSSDPLQVNEGKYKILLHEIDFIINGHEQAHFIFSISDSVLVISDSNYNQSPFTKIQ